MELLVAVKGRLPVIHMSLHNLVRLRLEQTGDLPMKTINLCAFPESRSAFGSSLPRASLWGSSSAMLSSQSPAASAGLVADARGSCFPNLRARASLRTELAPIVDCCQPVFALTFFTEGEAVEASKQWRLGLTYPCYHGLCRKGYSLEYVVYGYGVPLRVWIHVV